MMFVYFVALSSLLFSIGLVGAAVTRHFILMLLAVEIILSASILLTVAVFSSVVGGDAIGMLFAMWTVAACEIMGMVAIYRYMSRNGISMDVRKLSRLGE